MKSAVLHKLFIQCCALSSFRKKQKKWCVEKTAYGKLAQYGPLPIRILAGIAFIIHSLPNLSNIAGTEQFFANMVGLPAAMGLPIGLLEVIGGIALIVGVLTRIASILFIIEVIGFTITAKLSKGVLLMDMK